MIKRAEIGLRVMLVPGCEYAIQSKGRAGTITHVESFGGSWHSVQWDGDGAANYSYQLAHLMLAGDEKKYTFTIVYNVVYSDGFEDAIKGIFHADTEKEALEQLDEIIIKEGLSLIKVVSVKKKS